MTSSWFFLSTLNYVARPTTRQIYISLFRVSIHVNIPANSGKVLKLLHVKYADLFHIFLCDSRSSKPPLLKSSNTKCCSSQTRVRSLLLSRIPRSLEISLWEACDLSLNVDVFDIPYRMATESLCVLSVSCVHAAILCPHILIFPRVLLDITNHYFLLFCTMSNKYTIISQIITLLHVSTISCHPQGACNQYLAQLRK